MINVKPSEMKHEISNWRILQKMKSPEILKLEAKLNKVHAERMTDWDLIMLEEMPTL